MKQSKDPRLMSSKMLAITLIIRGRQGEWGKGQRERERGRET